MTFRHVQPRLGSIVLLAAMLILSGCAAKLPKLPVCDGKHRRDANPYGTVLPGAPNAGPVRAPGEATKPADNPLAKTSTVDGHHFYSSC